MINKKNRTFHKKKMSKRGFTLVELSIVLALIAIITGMTVTFSVLMNKFAAENTEKYDFLQDCAVVEKAIIEWVAENSDAKTVFTIDADKKALNLINHPNGDETNTTQWTTGLKNGTFALGAKTIAGVGTVYRVEFKFNDAKTLIKCTLFMGEGDDSFSSSFVFAPRLGSIGG